MWCWTARSGACWTLLRLFRHRRGLLHQGTPHEPARFEPVGPSVPGAASRIAVCAQARVRAVTSCVATLFGLAGRGRALLGLAGLVLVTSFHPAAAEFSAKDGQILGRTLSYIGNGMTGVAVVGIVYTPSVQTSQQEMDHIRAVIGDELPAGRIRLQARLVPVDQLATVTGLNALYVTSGLSGSTDAVFEAARRLHVPTISTDLDCVQSGGCVVGYSSEPTVQILLNQGAAERIGVHFLQAFRMLVREK